MRHSRLIVLAILVALATGCSDSNKQSRKAKAEARDGALRAKIADVGKRASADNSWMSAISEHRGAFTSFYSVDLEKLWLIDRPIVFAGALADVATDSGTDYKLLIRHSDFLSPELRLQILCAKDRVAPILSAIKSDKATTSPGVVVAAQITQVGFVTEPEREGTKTVFVGHGRCTDIAYIGDAFDLMFVLQDAAKK